MILPEWAEVIMSEINKEGQKAPQHTKVQYEENNTC